jgi:hypothetical protein
MPSDSWDSISRSTNTLDTIEEVLERIQNKKLSYLKIKGMDYDYPKT